MTASKREGGKEWRTAIAHQRSALSVSQISRLTAQSGPCSRWLVALSTLDAAASRAGGGPVVIGYITPYLLSRLSPQSKARLPTNSARRGRGSGVVRRYGALEIRRQNPAREEERSERRGRQVDSGTRGRRQKKERGASTGGVCLSTSASSTRVDDAWVPGPRGSEAVSNSRDPKARRTVWVANSGRVPEPKESVSNSRRISLAAAARRWKQQLGKTTASRQRGELDKHRAFKLRGEYARLNFPGVMDGQDCPRVPAPAPHRHGRQDPSHPYGSSVGVLSADLVQLSTAIAAEEDLGPFVRRAFACGRPEPLLASLCAAARDREDEIEELCRAHFHDFIHTIDNLRSLLLAMDAPEQRETRELAPGTNPSQIKHKLADKFITNAHELANPRSAIPSLPTSSNRGRRHRRAGEGAPPSRGTLLQQQDRGGSGAGGGGGAPPSREAPLQRRGRGGSGAGGGGAPPPREAPSQLRQRLMLVTFHCLEQRRRHDGGPGGASSGHGTRVEGGERARNWLRWGGDPALGCASLERQNGTRG
nr:unnamed protein product [Digitaria exilis]